MRIRRHIHFIATADLCRDLAHWWDFSAIIEGSDYRIARIRRKLQPRKALPRETCAIVGRYGALGYRVIAGTIFPKSTTISGEWPISSSNRRRRENAPTTPNIPIRVDTRGRQCLPTRATAMVRAVRTNGREEDAIKNLLPPEEKPADPETP